MSLFVSPKMRRNSLTLAELSNNTEVSANNNGPQLHRQPCLESRWGQVACAKRFGICDKMSNVEWKGRRQVWTWRQTRSHARDAAARGGDKDGASED